MSSLSLTQFMPSRFAFKVAVVAGLCFAGYCIYFDRKRRSDPNFKKRLRERRKKAKEDKQTRKGIKIPSTSDPEVLQKFFLECIQNGDRCIASGEIEEGIEYLTNAVLVCGQPEQFLQVLQQTVPPGVFQLLIQQPAVLERLQLSIPGMGNPMGAPPTSSGQSANMKLAEDDVE